MTTFLTLGSVTFTNFEIPSEINFGGSQALAVKQLIGGMRKIDAMGAVDDDISWSGLMFESAATERAKFLDVMRRTGDKHILTWGLFSYSVVIKEFKARFERFCQIPYSITVTVIEDLSTPINILFPVAYNDAILSLLTEANDLAVLIANPSISTAIALVNEVINNIPSIQDASNTALIPVVESITLASLAVSAAITATTTGIFS